MLIASITAMVIALKLRQTSTTLHGATPTFSFKIHTDLRHPHSQKELDRIAIQFMHVSLGLLSLKIHKRTFQTLFNFLSTKSFVYRKSVVRRTAEFKMEGLDFVSAQVNSRKMRKDRKNQFVEMRHDNALIFFNFKFRFLHFKYFVS
jgi:hypothetical protein